MTYGLISNVYDIFVPLMFQPSVRLSPSPPSGVSAYLVATTISAVQNYC
ncbi:hypothetical protein LINGRAHAP2_LOCUS33784 [Linum grandiflorum]